MDQAIIDRKIKLSIGAVAILAFLGILVETSLNVTFPLLTREFNVSLGTMQWVTSGYLLMVTIMMGTTGFLNRKFNARTLFIVALIFNLVGTTSCSIAQIFPILLLGRILQAISTGLATPLMYHIILSLVPVNKRGIYIGIAAMIISFAPALGPTYGGTLSAFGSWRFIFIITIPILLLVAWLGWKNISLAPENDNSQKFDWCGIILLTITFGSLSLAFANAGNYGFASYKFVSLIVLFFVALTSLIIYLHFSSRKIINFKLLANPIIRLRWLNFFVLQFINIGISFVIPMFAEACLHASAFTAGLMLLPGALVGAFISPVAGKLFDKYGALKSLFVSSIVLVCGTTLFFITTPIVSIIGVTLNYILLRIGFNLGFSNSMSDATLYIKPEENADMNSLFNTFQQYAGSLSISVLSAIISINQAKQGNRSSLTQQGSQIDYAILLILAVISLVTVLLSRHYSIDKANK